MTLGRMGLAAFLLFMMAAVGVPAAEVLHVSLLDETGAFTLEHYREVLGDGYFRAALVQTVLFCALTSLAAAMLALPAAWRIGRAGRGATWLRVFCQANYAFGGIVYGMLMVALIGNVGLVPLAEAALFGSDLSRGFVYTVPGLAIAYFGFQIPRSALLLAQAIEKLDPDLLRAARTLGARPAQTALLVLLPLLRGAIANTALSTFLISIASFGVALLVSRALPIYTVLIYKEFIGFSNFGTATAMAVVLSLSTLAVVAAARRWTNRSEAMGI
jgi:putative spermidine/putrescine transport system permease protein